MLKKTLIASALLISSFGANAQVIGNSALMTQAFEQQLESYIGTGYLDFTNIFTKNSTKVAYNDSTDWHRDVDNKGPTVSLMEVISNIDQSRVIVAGYNPFSWNSSGTWLQSTSTTAFLANLTHSNLFQKNTQSSYIAYNHSLIGPSFGGGHDFRLSGNLTTGFANLGLSYGDVSRYGTEAYRQSLTGTGGYNAWTVGKLETFTLTAGLYEPLTPVAPTAPIDPVTPPASVSTPVTPPTSVSAPLMGGGLMLAMGLLGMRNRKQTLHSA
jgi:hypothetical protein